MIGAALKFSDPVAARPVLEAELATLMRCWPLEYENIMTAQVNLANCLTTLNQHDGAEASERPRRSPGDGNISASERHSATSSSCGCCKRTGAGHEI